MAHRELVDPRNPPDGAVARCWRRLEHGIAGLRDREVLKVAGIYSIALWATFLALDVALPDLDYDSLPIQWLVLGGVAGLPVAVAAVWFLRTGDSSIASEAQRRRATDRVRTSEIFINLALVLSSALLAGLLLLLV